MKKAFPYERMTVVYFINLLSQTILTISYYSLYIVKFSKGDVGQDIPYSYAVLQLSADVVFYM